MESLPSLFTDLALILVTAGVTTVLFKWLKQPLVLGYIIAGFLIGPHFSWFPVITDSHSIHAWSEIGMVFLLFAIGLEFSFKKLKKVAGKVGITALTELVSMCIIGFFLGKLLGWSQMDCIFLGAMLSMSSTTIIVKAFEDLKLKHEKFTESVIGVLVVEDLAAILMMVILSTLSVNQSFDAAKLLDSMLKLVLLLLAWFIGGIFIIPTILRWIRKFMTEETLTVVAVGLCFSMVIFAAKVGFSSALGAFIMGSIMAETLEAETIHKVTSPVKNLFGAVFFVSVGMMVDPAILAQYWWQILVITIVVLVLKSLSSGIGMMLSGDTLKNSVCAGVCFGQLGEFSFIIASVGLSFHVIDEFLYPIIVSVSIITTFITPYSIKAGVPLANWIEKHVPKRWVRDMNDEKQGIRTKDGKTLTMGSFFLLQLKNTVIYTAIIIALTWLCFYIDNHILVKYSSILSHAINCAITILFVSPFLWAVAFNHKSRETHAELINANKFNHTVVSVVYVIRYLIVTLVFFNILTHYFLPQVPNIHDNFRESFGINSPDKLIRRASFFMWLASLVLLGLLRLITPVMGFYNKIETWFLKNFNKREDLQAFNVPEVLQENFRLDEWELSSDSVYAGQSLKDTDFRGKFNLSVVSVVRGEKVFDLPDKDFMLFPNDKITFVGSEENLMKLKGKVEIEDEVLIHETAQNDVDLHKLLITNKVPFFEKPIKDSGLRQEFGAMVIALERGDDFILNPAADVVIKDNDVMWFVSSDASAKKLKAVLDS